MEVAREKQNGISRHEDERRENDRRKNWRGMGKKESRIDENCEKFLGKYFRKSSAFHRKLLGNRRMDKFPHQPVHRIPFRVKLRSLGKTKMAERASTQSNPSNIWCRKLGFLLDFPSCFPAFSNQISTHRFYS